MSHTIAGIQIPDSTMAADATQLLRDVASEFVFHHSRRVFLFASLRGQKDGLDYDPELLYVGTMFHDLGLTERFARDDQRFEIDAADEARRFLSDYGIDGEAADRVWNAIALHTTPEIPLHMAPEVALVTRGVELDVLGIGYDEITDAQRDAVVEAHPRPTFKKEIVESFAQGLRHRPETTFGNVKADVLAHTEPGFKRMNFVEIIQNSAWPT